MWVHCPQDFGRIVNRRFIPPQHIELYEKLPYILVGTQDTKGRPWASMLAGPPGFIKGRSPTQLQFTSTVAEGDVFAESVREGGKVGVLSQELHTRRRNRLNGTIVGVGEGRWGMEADVSFGNCPKYITARLGQVGHTSTETTRREICLY